jgi:hypothetical protein
VEEILDRVEAHNLGDAQVPYFASFALFLTLFRTIAYSNRIKTFAHKRRLQFTFHLQNDLIYKMNSLSQVPLFKRIAACINSPHFQVSERSIYVLNNDVILRFVTNNRQTLVPILCKALTSNTWLQVYLLSLHLLCAKLLAPSSSYTPLTLLLHSFLAAAQQE